MVSLAAARAAVAAVADPELPVVTIADLGILRDVSRVDGRVVVTITPTYSGCPAMDTIRHDIRDRLADVGVPDAQVRTELSPPWTTDLITPAGRAKLAAAGIAPPGPRGAQGRAPGPRGAGGAEPPGSAGMAQPDRRGAVGSSPPGSRGAVGSTPLGPRGATGVASPGGGGVAGLGSGGAGGPVAVRLSVRCPRCGSLDTEELSRFSSTACTALWRCRGCGEPFDRVKEH